MKGLFIQEAAELEDPHFHRIGNFTQVEQQNFHLFMTRMEGRNREQKGRGLQHRASA